MSVKLPVTAPVIDHVSVSSITTYLKCPRQWEHRYLLATPPAHVPGVLAFGKAIHAALALFYGKLRRCMEEPTVEELGQMFSDRWGQELAGDIPVLLDDGDTAGNLKDKALEMLRAFVDKAHRPVRVLGVEESFSVELHYPTSGHSLPLFVGWLDAVVEVEGGRLLILEHKTAARRYSESKLAHDLQATGYSLAAQLMGTPADVAFQVLSKTKSPTLDLHLVKRNVQDHLDFLQTVAGVLRAVEAGAFYPVRDWWCRGCPYAGPCLAG
jgi:putative RecB family exonuclease